MHIHSPVCKNCNASWVKQFGNPFRFTAGPEVKVYRMQCNVCKHRFLHYVPESKPVIMQPTMLQFDEMSYDQRRAIIDAYQAQDMKKRYSLLAGGR